MTTQLALLGTAFTLGFVHTLLGPDHYVPFVAMSRAGRWTLKKTVVITLLCGLGHVLSSVLLGLVGIAAGVMLVRLEAIESIRGDVAGWLLLGFGLAYFVAGVVKAVRNMPHSHWHSHGDGTMHAHSHDHAGDHLHAHERNAVQTGDAADAPAAKQAERASLSVSSSAVARGYPPRRNTYATMAGSLRTRYPSKLRPIACSWQAAASRRTSSRPDSMPPGCFVLLPRPGRVPASSPSARFSASMRRSTRGLARPASRSSSRP